MENKWVVGADFTLLLLRLKAERPESHVYLQSNVLSNKFALLDEAKEVLVETDYETFILHALAFETKIAETDGEEFLSKLKLAALDDTSWVQEADLAMHMMQFLATPPKPKTQRGKSKK